MSSLKDVKQITKICPGYLTRTVGTAKFSATRARSERDIAKKVFSVHSVGSDEDAVPVFQRRNPGKFEIHIHNVQLTEDCLKYVYQQFGDNVQVKVTWKFFEFNKSVTPFEECTDVKIVFDSMFVYAICLSHEFIEYLKNKSIAFELFAANIEKQICLGKGRTTFMGALENVDTRQRARLELFDYYKARQAGEKPKPSARLDIFFKLICDAHVLKNMLKKVKAFSGDPNQTNILNLQSAFEVAVQESKNISDKGSKSVMPTDSELNNFEEALDLVLTRNKALRTTQSEISHELKDRAQWLRLEADWRRTLQEHAILRGTDPDNIKWRQWRDTFTSNVSIKKYADFPAVYKPILIITILKMVLFEESPPMVNEEMTKFYIEYSFLGYEGPDMETPESVYKPIELTDGFEFNFVKKYSIDPQKNLRHCHELSEFIRKGENLVFNVISEPEEDESVPIQACELVGFCEVSLFEVAHLESNIAAYWFDVNDCHSPKDTIGYLKIQIEGIQAMRQIALKILAPTSYNIIQ